jgi:predicted MPP superfamily phosphohydrolase
MVEFAFAWIVIASAAVDALVALAVLFSVPRSHAADLVRPRVGLGRVGVALAVTTAGFVAKAVVLLGVGLNAFGLMNVIYVDLVVVVPLLGLVLLVADRVSRRLTWPVRGLAIASLGLLLVGYYATFWEPFRLIEESALVPLAPERTGTKPVRIGVLTDIQIRHVTSYEQNAIDRLLALRPDVILIPGDVFQGDDDVFEAERPALRALLARLEAPGGVFLVPGDVDQGTRRVARLVEGTHIVPLIDDLARVEVAGRTLTIGGVELAYMSTSARQVVTGLEGGPGDTDIRILVAHRPDVIFNLSPSSRIDLTVAGHTHGGQVVVPGFGPLITLSNVPRQVAAGGLHTLNGNKIYVSRGVGCERGQAPRLRFFCPPEITLIEVGKSHQ